MKISVIIPVYNVEQYLSQCIDSVISQTYKNLEIILVNDGSQDRSGRICDDYAEKDLRIRVLHQKNSGVSVARNAGISIAIGQYITFVDSDDWILPEMYENMMNCVKDSSPIDVVMCDTAVVSKTSKHEVSEKIRAGLYTKQEIVTELYPTLLATEDFGKIPIISACTCLIQRDLVLKNDIYFDPSLKFSEDYLYMAKLMLHANSYCYLKGQYFYNYRQYEVSRSKKFDLAWWPTLLDLHDKLDLLLADSKEYNFQKQLDLQLVHSSLLVSGNISKTETIYFSEKLKLLREVFANHELGLAFSRLDFKKQSTSQKIVLRLIKHKTAVGYLSYVKLIALLKK